MRTNYGSGNIQVMGAAPQQGREGAAPPHVALSPKGILLSIPHHIQITRIEKHKQRIQREGKERGGKETGKQHKNTF
jgi:hypothetical protein